MSSSRVPLARFIPKEELESQKVRHWHFGSMDDTAVELEPLPFALGSVLDSPRKPEPELEPELDVQPEPAVATEEFLELQSYLQTLEQEHAQQLAQMQAEHEVALQQAQENALAQGEAQGRQSASTEWQQRMDDYVASEGQATAERLQQLEAAFAEQLKILEKGLSQEVLRLSCAIAQQVVRRELTNPARVLESVVREAVELVIADRKPITVRLHPQDHAKLSEDLARLFPDTADIQWIADDSVDAGGCRVESAGAVIDGTVAARWERAVSALGMDVPWQPGDDGDGI